MSPDNRLAAFGEQVGFDVIVEPHVVRAVGVPCCLKDKVVGTCTIEKSCDPASGKPTKRLGDAVHAVRITVAADGNGRVYHADGTSVGNYVGGDGRTWSNISIRKGNQASPENDELASDVVYRYAKQIVGAAWAAGYFEATSPVVLGPFNIPNTFEARAGLGPVQDRIRGQGIAIIGLGGTGAYVLDLVNKTPLQDIYLLDFDVVEWHTFKRAPGAPTAEEIKSVREGRLPKVDYYHSKYTSFRQGIYPHAIRVDSKSTLSEFLSAHPVDFAFVCIDQLTIGDSPRQDVVYCALSEAGVPFIDSGVSIMIEEGAVTGAITTSFYEAGSMTWMDAIPNAKIEGDISGYHNVQLPEVNALAAALAVMEWRRRTGQYVSHSTSFLHKFRLESTTVRHAE